jgi:HK97 family phage prohead protease
MTEFERRPAPGIAQGEVRFPPEWVDRYGRPPVDNQEREAWLVNAIRGGEPTRTDREQTRDLIAETDAYLARLEDEDGLRLRYATAAPAAAPKRRATATVTGSTLHGMAVPYNGRSSWLGFMFERFLPTAFDEQRRDGWKSPPVMGHVMHDRRNALGILGSVHAGTMELEHRGDGLYYCVEPPSTGIGPYTVELVRRGDLSGASIGFLELDGEWSLTEDDKPLRTVSRALLGEVSIVHRGAYPQATVNERRAVTLEEFGAKLEARERRYRDERARRERYIMVADRIVDTWSRSR